MTPRSTCPGCGGRVPPRKAPGPVKVYCTKKCGKQARDRLAKIERARLAKLPAPKPTFAGTYLYALSQGIDLLEERDASRECRHGRLPGYTGTACDCWSGVTA